MNLILTLLFWTVLSLIVTGVGFRRASAGEEGNNWWPFSVISGAATGVILFLLIVNTSTYAAQKDIVLTKEQIELVKDWRLMKQEEQIKELAEKINSQVK